MSSPPSAVGAYAVSIAERYLVVRYVWGGVCAYGVDCSGLVHLAWRLFGVTLPRDAADQAAATTPIPFGQERPGDLYFFARPGEPIHHVGFVASGAMGNARQVLHASGEVGRVVLEDLVGERAETLVATHRVTA